MNYYLYDDCVMIHEPPQRNLGIVTGRFLEKVRKEFWEDCDFGEGTRIGGRVIMVLTRLAYSGWAL
jgi:hypothetical protein